MINGVIAAAKKVVAKKTKKVTAVIVAAGKSERMKGMDKIFMPVGDEPLIAETVSVFEKCEDIDEIILVLKEDSCERGEMLVKMHGFTKVAACIPGGETRAESSYIGVRAANKKSNYIVIHDGARPMVTDEMITSAVDAAVKHGAATAAIPVTSTVKRCVGGVVSETVDRSDLYEIQTPQAFRSDVIKAALKNAVDKKLEITDDCMAVEAIGLMPKIVMGSRNNIKVTVREDAAIVKALMENRRTEK